MFKLSEETIINYIQKEVECYGLKNTTIKVRELKSGKFRVKVDNIDAEINEVIKTFEELKEHLEMFHDEMLNSTSETAY